MTHDLQPDQQRQLQKYRELTTICVSYIIPFTVTLRHHYNGVPKFDFFGYDLFPNHEDEHYYGVDPEFNRNKLRELIEFINTASIHDVIRSVSVNTQQRVELLKPWLWHTVESNGLYETHNFLRLSSEFTELLLYPHSKRPVTDMKKFWELYEVPPEARRILSEPDPHWTVPFTVSGFLFLVEKLGITRDVLFSIPVLRYVQGMSRSLFYTTDTSYISNHGTYFYYDPDSAANLLTSTTLVAINKIHALALLGVSLEEVFAIFEESDFYGTLAERFYRKDLSWWERLFGDPFNVHPSELKWPECFWQVLRLLYTSTAEKVRYSDLFYGVEDTLDERLWSTAKAQGIEAVVLARMTGGNRFVSEVLSTNNYQTTFSNVWIRA